MPVAPSFQDLLDLGQAEAQARRPDLAFIEGDITVAQLHGAAAMGDRVIQYAVEAFRDTFFGGAKADALTELVSDRTGIERKEATAATATVRFTRTSGGAGGTIPLGTRVGTGFDSAGNQVVFTTDSPQVVGAAANGPFDLSVTAVDTGTAGNVAANTIVQILDTLFDSTFSIYNPSAAGGGNLEESDAELVERARLFYQTQRRGTLEALEFGALLVPSVRSAHAYEDPETFAVAVLVSDSDGASSLEMTSDVAAELENWRCAGVHVEVLGGQQLVVDLAITLAEFRPGFSVADAAPSIIDLVTARINRLRTREIAYLDNLVGAIVGIAPDDILDVTFTSISVAGNPQAIADINPDNVLTDGTGTLRAGTITVI